MRNILFFIAFASLLLAAELSEAGASLNRIPSSMTRAATALNDSSNAFEKGSILPPELILTYQQVKKQEKQNIMVDPISTEAEKFQGKNADQASLMVADRYAQYWWEHSEARNSSLGKRVDFVENSVQKEIAVQKGETLHKFDFSVQTFSSLAKFEYSGFFKAALSYQARDASSALEVTNTIWNKKDLILSASQTNIEQRSAINLKWNW